MSRARARAPSALYVVISAPDNPHANAEIEVFTSKRKAERARKWGDQQLVEYARVRPRRF